MRNYKKVARVTLSLLVGSALLVLGWRLARRMGLVGAGLAVIIQGAALALLDLVLAGQISR